MEQNITELFDSAFATINTAITSVALAQYKLRLETHPGSDLVARKPRLAK